ncbi:MAG: hypothetical protein HY667_05070, partial [Chloroflexi bacterium]|nr:hypothetical protein [Chloroflexota bacterium]
MHYRVSSLVLAVALFLIRGNPAYAHERWFVDQGRHFGESHWLDGTNLTIMLGGLLLIALAVLVDRSGWSRKLQEVFDKLQRILPKGIEWRVVAFLAAVMLIVNAFAGVFLAPDLVLPGRTVTADRSISQIHLALLAGQSPLPWSAATFGGIAQLLLAALLLSQISFLIPGVLIILVALPMAIIYFAPGLLVDYAVEFGALGLALVFFGMGTGWLDRRLSRRLKLDPSRYAQLPVPIIRIGAGLTLAILALHNKLLFPDMALTFLDEHDYNFMPLLGFTGFTNLHFVFAAGVVELTMG